MTAPRIVTPEEAQDCDQRIAQIRARLAAATPGPWAAWQNKDAEPEVSQQGSYYMGLVATPSHQPADYGRANADLIANAPADLAWLLAERDCEEARTRAAVVRALRKFAGDDPITGAMQSWLEDKADAIENGADY